MFRIDCLEPYWPTLLGQQALHLQTRGSRHPQNSFRIGRTYFIYLVDVNISLSAFMSDSLYNPKDVVKGKKSNYFHVNLVVTSSLNRPLKSNVNCTIIA